jgi:hypothetical protein
MISLSLFPFVFMIATLAVSNVVASFTLTTSIMKKKTSTLRQDATRITNFQALGIDLNVHHHCIHLQMSKEEDFFSDPEEGTGNSIDTSDFEIVSMEDGEISDEFLADMQQSAPNQLEIMKEVR